MKLLDLYAELRTEGDAAVRANLQGIRQEAGSVQQSFASVQSSLLGMAAGVMSVATIWSGMKALADDDRAFTRLSGVLRATGGAAGHSAGELRAYADTIEKSRGTSSDALMSAMAVLATFKNVNRSTFMEGIEQAQNLAIVWGTDVTSAARAVGLALDDPINGMMGLSRMGVRFTDEQKATVESLVATGDAAKAQALILDELESKFGGVAEAAGKDLKGKLDKLGESWEDLTKRMAKPAVGLITVAGVGLEVLEAVEGGVALMVYPGGRGDSDKARAIREDTEKIRKQMIEDQTTPAERVRAQETAALRAGTPPTPKVPTRDELLADPLQEMRDRAVSAGGGIEAEYVAIAKEVRALETAHDKLLEGFKERGAGDTAIEGMATQLRTARQEYLAFLRARADGKKQQEEWEEWDKTFMEGAAREAEIANEEERRIKDALQEDEDRMLAGDEANERFLEKRDRKKVAGPMSIESYIGSLMSAAAGGDDRMLKGQGTTNDLLRSIDSKVGAERPVTS